MTEITEIDKLKDFFRDGADEFDRERLDSGDTYWFGDYTPLLKSIAPILVQVDENEYQGSSWVLFRNTEKNLYGYLSFGWGSCSGCDALQACYTWADALKLRNELDSEVQWKTHDEMVGFLREHDWEGDWSWSKGELKQFIQKAEEALGVETIDGEAEDVTDQKELGA